MKDTEIRDSLFSRFNTLNSFSGIQLLKGNDVDFCNNKVFNQPDDYRFYRVKWLPAKPSQIGMYNTGLERYTGILQIDICTPKGKGEQEADNKMKWICKLFAVGTCFDNVEVTACYKANVMEEENLLRTIVRVEIDADIDNNKE